MNTTVDRAAVLKYIETLDENGLRDLNRIILDRGRNMLSARALVAGTKFKIGQPVKFRTRQGITVTGTVQKINVKTCKVRDSHDGIWNVTSTLLTAIGG